MRHQLLLRAGAGVAGAAAVVLIVLETVQAKGTWGMAALGGIPQPPSEHARTN
jgi:hypothetical protein